MYDHDGQIQHQQKGKEHAVRYGHDNAMLGYHRKISINMDDTGSSDNECSESSSGVFWRNILIFILIGSDGKF